MKYSKQDIEQLQQQEAELKKDKFNWLVNDQMSKYEGASYFWTLDRVASISDFDAMKQ